MDIDSQLKFNMGTFFYEETLTPLLESNWNCNHNFYKINLSLGQLNPDVIVPEGNRKIYMDLLSDLKKKVVKKHGEPNDIILPLECHYLNKNAFISVVGHQPQVGYLPHLS